MRSTPSDPPLPLHNNGTSDSSESHSDTLIQLNLPLSEQGARYQVKFYGFAEISAKIFLSARYKHLGVLLIDTISCNVDINKTPMKTLNSKLK